MHVRLRSLFVFLLLAFASAGRLEAHPRMISFEYTNCIQCHVAPQGRGLLTTYGRGIDMEQSLSDVDLTARALGVLVDPKYNDEWDGRFGPVLADFVATSRINHDLERTRTAAVFSGVYRQAIFLGKKKSFRINTEVGLRDTALADTRLGSGLTATGGDEVFLKKATIDWRLGGSTAAKGAEISIGRDYLPLGLQLDDYSSYLLHLNRDGIHDVPVQVKYFGWREKSLASVFLHGPTFEEASARREWGGGFLYEHYPSEKLALGLRSIIGFSDESDRLRLSGFARWGLSKRWALLSQADYTRYWDAGAPQRDGGQFTGFLQLYHHHTEWLVSSLTGNYANSDLLDSGRHHLSGRYTLAARLNRNLTIGLTYATGDIRRDLGSGQEAAAFLNVKF